jgi:hypothetical protein
MKLSDEQTLKPIETKYKGYRFRSRLEARWAVFFDELGVEWEYEKEGYVLSTGERYLPDFWMPGGHMWIEVKGESPSEKYLEMLRNFSSDSNCGVLLVTGLPGEKESYFIGLDITDSSGGAYNEFVNISDINKGHLKLVTKHDDRVNRDRTVYSGFWEHPVNISYSLKWEISPEVKKAIEASKSARFEHRELSEDKPWQ